MKSNQPDGSREPSPDEVREDVCSFHLTSDSLHDLASPVNQAGSLVDLILNKYGGSLDSEADVLFGFLQTAIRRLQNLLIGLTRYEHAVGSPAPLRHSDGETVLARALAMQQQAIQKNQASITHDHLPELYCDPDQITYVFANLIDNSIKFRGEQTPEIHVSAISQDDRELLLVRDNGIGIEPRYAKRIFAAFKRIHNEDYPGAGIGLAIAQRIVERHNGRIWVESELGKGATFFVALPKPA